MHAARHVAARVGDEEGGERVYSVNTLEFLDRGDGSVGALRVVDVESQVVDGRPGFVPVEGSQRELPVDVVFLAMGFLGPQRPGLLDGLGVEIDPRGNIVRDGNWATSEEGVFVCGDAGRGQSLIVWAIAEGRSCAAAVDAHLMGETDLPALIRPTDRPLV